MDSLLIFWGGASMPHLHRRIIDCQVCHHLHLVDIIFLHPLQARMILKVRVVNSSNTYMLLYLCLCTRSLHEHYCWLVFITDLESRFKLEKNLSDPLKWEPGPKTYPSKKAAEKKGMVHPHRACWLESVLWMHRMLSCACG